MLFIGPGAVIVIDDRVCLYGCILCVDACTPRQLLFFHSLALLFIVLYVPDTGYQWAPLHVCEVESPSGSVLGSMG